MANNFQIKEKNHKIHILHLINSLIIGGAEVALLHYIQALGQEDYHHYVYSFGPDGPIRKKIEALGVPVHFGPKRASIKNPFKFCTALFALIKNLLDFIRLNKIQLIQSHLNEPNQLAVLIGKLSNIPAFPTIHSTNLFFGRRSVWDPRINLLKIVNLITYRIADRVIAISPEVKDIIRNSYGLKDYQVVVLKNGLIFKETSEEPGSLQEKCHNLKNKLKIIAIGRLSSEKYFEVLIKAAAEAMNQKLDLLVLILGEGEERSRLERLILELAVDSNVKLLGIRHDVLELMKGSDIFVMTSRYEGLSIAMIEAMACGLPVIASDAPGLRGYIDHGENGLLFEIGQHKELADIFIRFDRDKKLRSKLSCGARNTFTKEFDMRKNIIPLDMLFRQHVSV